MTREEKFAVWNRAFGEYLPKLFEADDVGVFK
jgi:hypothetical protein